MKQKHATEIKLTITQLDKRLNPKNKVNESLDLWITAIAKLKPEIKSKHGSVLAQKLIEDLECTRTQLFN